MAVSTIGEMAYRLAMLVKQSDLYNRSADVRESVDVILFHRRKESVETHDDRFIDGVSEQAVRAATDGRSGEILRKSLDLDPEDVARRIQALSHEPGTTAQAEEIEAGGRTAVQDEVGLVTEAERCNELGQAWANDKPSPLHV